MSTQIPPSLSGSRPHGLPVHTPQVGRKEQTWTIVHDPHEPKLYRENVAKFGGLAVAEMIKDGTLPDGTQLRGPDGSMWQVYKRAKVRLP